MLARLRFCLAVAGSALAVHADGQTLAAAPNVSMALALEAVQTAIAECQSSGRNVAASVIDSAGVQKAFLAADGAPRRAVETSTQKAQTALALQMSTLDAAAKAKTDQAVAQAYAAQPNLLIQPGGRPIRVAGEVVGAIGVGGAATEQDDACAQAAVARISGQLK